MNNRDIETRQELPAEENTSPVFITRKKRRSSTIAFVVTSITLGLVIAVMGSLTQQFSGAFLIGGVMAVLMATIIIQRPELGAYLLIITVFINLSDYATERGLPSINQPLIAITYISIFVNYIVLRKDSAIAIPRISRVEWALLAYFLIIVISLFLAPERSSAFDLIIDISKDILTGLCIYFALNTKEKWEKGVWLFIIVIANLSLLGVIKMVSGTDYTFGGLAQLSGLGQRIGDTEVLRYGGPTGASNIWAQVLVATIPLILYRLGYEKNAFVKANLVFAALFTLLAISYTGSRGAIVALITILPLIAIERKVHLPTILFGITALLVLAMILPSSYIDRFRSLGIFFDTQNEYNLSQDESIEGRRSAMLAGLAMFQANPFLGVGFGNYGTNYWEYANKIGLDSFSGDVDPEDLPKAHSLYVEIISETGLFGIIAFGTFFGSLLSGMLRTRKQHYLEEIDSDWNNWMTAFFFAMLSFLISGIFLHGILWRYIWMLIGFSMGALAISENRTINFEADTYTQ